MSYEVLVDNLRSAAGKYDAIAGKLGTDGVQVTHVDPDSFGHVELAAWTKAVADQCHQATRALHDGAAGLADGLDAAARHYETTDQGVASSFASPFGTATGTPTGSPFLFPPQAGAR